MFGANFQLLLDQATILCMKDAQNQPIHILGQKTCTFKIGPLTFQHDLIFYEADQTEILVGFDILYKMNIALLPYIGLQCIPTDSTVHNVNRINHILPHYQCQITEDITLCPKQQRVVTVKIDLKHVARKLQEKLTNQHLILHSETLQPEVEFSALSVYFQYCIIMQNYTTRILLSNNTDVTTSYRKGDVICHAEHMLPLHKEELDDHLKEDDLMHTINLVYQDMTGPPKSVQIPESDIQMHLQEKENKKPDFKATISCQSKDKDDIEWLVNLHNRYQHAFTAHHMDIGRLHSDPAEIRVKPNAQPKVERCRPIPAPIREEAFAILDQLLKQKIISYSNTSWSAPCFFVKKSHDEYKISDPDHIAGQKDFSKKQKLRFIVDYRYLNSCLDLTQVTNWPIITLRDILQRLHSAKYVASIDFSNSFFHVPLSEQSKHYTGFICDDIKYHFNVLPQGFALSPKIMQEKMRQILIKHDLNQSIIYIDNLIVYGLTKEDYKFQLERTIKAFAEAGIKIKTSKSHYFLTEKFNLFGFELCLRTHTIKPAKDKIEKIMDIPEPNTRKRLKSFIGSVAYFSPMIPELQRMLRPLHEQTSLKAKFNFSIECQEAFKKVKRAIALTPLIHLMDPSKEVYIYTDGAMGDSVAYSIYQKSSVLNQLVPIKYNSHCLTPAEKNYSQIECEALAILFCLTSEADLIQFTHIFLNSDCRGLVFLSRFKSSCSKLNRWDIYIRSFNITILFKPATDPHIRIVDLLTRKDQKNKPFNKRPTTEQIDDLLRLDFFKCNPLTYQDTMSVIGKLIKMFDKAKLTAKVTSQQVKTIQDKWCIAPITFTPLNQQVGQKGVINKVHSAHSSDITLPAPVSQISISQLTWKSKLKEPFKSELLENLHFYLPGINKKIFIKMQEEDEFASKLIKKIKLQNFKPHNDFYIKEDILLKRNKHGKFWQVVVPQIMASKLIKTYHNQDLICHPSGKKMDVTLKYIFLIRNFRKLAEKVVQTCTFCSLNKPYPTKKLPQGIPLKINAPRQFISLDICVINTSHKANTSYLTIVDNFSLYSIFVPCKENSTAQEIVEILFSYWFRYMGIPLFLCTDGGKNLSNKTIGTIASLLNIKLFKISAYNSKANISERLNKVCNYCLRYLYSQYGLSENIFSLFLSYVSLMWNSSKLIAGFSPFFLQTGAEMRKHSFISLMKITQAANYGQYVQGLIKVQNMIYMLSKQREEKRKNIQAQNISLDMYKVGTFVLLKKQKKPGPLHKLKTVYYDIPFRIIKSYSTNVLLLPWRDEIQHKRRYKNEGKIPKFSCILAKKTRLKPISHPHQYLDTKLTTKFFSLFNTVLTDFKPPSVTLQPSYKLTNKDKKVLEPVLTKFLSKQNNGSIKIQAMKPGKLPEKFLQEIRCNLQPADTFSKICDSLQTLQSTLQNLENTNTKLSEINYILPKKRKAKVTKKSLESLSFSSNPQLGSISSEDLNYQSLSDDLSHQSPGPSHQNREQQGIDHTYPLHVDEPGDTDEQDYLDISDNDEQELPLLIPNKVQYRDPPLLPGSNASDSGQGAVGQTDRQPYAIKRFIEEAEVEILDTDSVRSAHKSPVKSHKKPKSKSSYIPKQRTVTRQTSFRHSPKSQTSRDNIPQTGGDGKELNKPKSILTKGAKEARDRQTSIQTGEEAVEPLEGPASPKPPHTDSIRRSVRLEKKSNL